MGIEQKPGYYAMAKKWTYTKPYDRVQPRSRTCLNSEYRSGERNLLILPEDIKAETDDDNRCDVDATCACLDGLEDDQTDGRNDRREPGYKVVDGAPNERSDKNTQDADQSEETDDEPIRMIKPGIFGN